MLSSGRAYVEVISAPLEDKQLRFDDPSGVEYEAAAKAAGLPACAEIFDD